MTIVDDYLALLAVAGVSPVAGPVATTYSYHYRLGRAMADPSSRGALTKAASDVAMRMVLDPPPSRLVVLDPRRSLGEAVAVSARRGTNLLLSELLGAALAHGAAIRVATKGVRWQGIMEAEGVDFEVVSV